MEKTSLYIMIETERGNVVKFAPIASEPVRINKMTYTAQRMGSTPSISADIYYPIILDKEWSHKEFLEFRGERYYVDMTPSAEKDNKSLLYKHSISFVSERIVLEHEFFYDVVTETTEAQYKDRFRSNVAKFSFMGTITEFAARLNDSLVYTGMYNPDTEEGYHVVLDEGMDTGETKEVSFDNKRFSEALGEISSTYKLAYYFVGKTIHIGYTENVINRPFEYGKEGGLLKIQHTNSNNAIVDRITGIGSSENLPYYYPNKNAAGDAIYEVSDSGVAGDDVIDNIRLDLVTKFQPMYEGKTFMLHKCNTENSAKIKDIKDNGLWSSGLDFFNEINATGEHRADDYKKILNDDSYVTSRVMFSQLFKTKRWCVASTTSVLKDYFGKKGETIKAENLSPKGRLACNGYPKDKATPTTEEMVFPDKYLYELIIFLDYIYDDKTGTQRVELVHTYRGNKFPASTPDTKDVGEFTFQGNCTYNIYIEERVIFRVSLSDIGIDYLPVSEQTVNEHLANYNWQLFAEHDIPITTSWRPRHPYGYIDAEGYWMSDGETNGAYKDSGFIFKDHKAINVATHKIQYADKRWSMLPAEGGTKVLIKKRQWINPTHALMPSIYRESLGAERYYNAVGVGNYKRTFEQYGVTVVKDYEDAYRIGSTDKHYEFLNLYQEGNPHADYQQIEDIKPTIKDVRNDIILYNNDQDRTPVNVDEDGNAAGQLLGEIADIAFDSDDDDSLKDANSKDSTEYNHSYFYIKLHKFNGPMGFNIFDYASESDTAKINMTSGNCAGCSFEIGVPEPKEVENGKYKFTNGVQVDVNGNIKEGTFGDKVRNDRPQPIQQDTSKAEVWIALKKETTTMGVIMPNASENIRPAIGDTFTITGINAPHVYITAAEKRLDKALVKHMMENNNEKFNFTITLSRIWLAEHPEIADKLNENARIYVKYNGAEIFLYVTGYTVKTDGKVLEEISITLADEIDDISAGTLTARLSSMRDDILDTIANRDYAAILSLFRKYFLNRKLNSPQEERTMLDRAFFNAGIETQNLDVLTDARVSENLSVNRSATIGQDAEVSNNTNVGNDLRVGNNTFTAGTTYFGNTFIPGLLGKGGMVDKDGRAEMRSLKLWETLEVPELRYNRVSVYTGIDWDTFGGGIISSVEVDMDESGNILMSGIITLKLEDGEMAAVAEGDLCQGIYHFSDSENDAETKDERNGNFHFAGFGTVYFRIVEILDKGNNGRFRYVLRGVDEKWTQTRHPQPQMNFACYANPTNEQRQACRYSTTEYSIGLRNMTDWTYDGDNIYKIDGILDGFMLNGKTFEGTGTILGNAYVYGHIEQFDNAVVDMTIESSHGELLMEGEETMLNVSITRGFTDILDEVATWKLSRETGNAKADAAWINEHPMSGPSVKIAYGDLSSVNGKTLFRITAYDAKGNEIASNTKAIGWFRNGENGVSIDSATTYYTLTEGSLASVQHTDEVLIPTRTYGIYGYKDTPVNLFFKLRQSGHIRRITVNGKTYDFIKGTEGTTKATRLYSSVSAREIEYQGITLKELESFYVSATRVNPEGRFYYQDDIWADSDGKGLANLDGGSKWFAVAGLTNGDTFRIDMDAVDMEAPTEPFVYVTYETVDRDNIVWSAEPLEITETQSHLWKYEHTVYTDGINTWAKDTEPVLVGVYGQKGDQGDDGKDSLLVVISATNGSVFKNGKGTTMLVATFIIGGEDITSTLDKTKFVWTKKNSDGSEDTAWNTANKGRGNIVTVTADDVDERATFFCEYTGAISGYRTAD